MLNVEKEDPGGPRAPIIIITTLTIITITTGISIITHPSSYTWYDIHIELHELQKIEWARGAGGVGWRGEERVGRKVHACDDDDEIIGFYEHA